MSDFKKIVRIGQLPDGNAFAEIEYKNEKLSISGAIGPKSNGDCTGSCGQWNMSFKECDARGHYTIADVTPAPGWTKETVFKFLQVWDRWHLNDMRANCEHQTGAAWNTSEKIEVISYGLTTEAWKKLTRLQTAVSVAAAKGVILPMDAEEKALLSIGETWHQGIYSPPDADSPLSGCYKVTKRETKTAGWVYPHQHPRGLLTKPCAVCGYKYGSEWKKESVPADVLEFLQALPETDIAPAWV